MHDFREKLSDPRVAAQVQSYLKRARRLKGLPPLAGETAMDEEAHGPVSINLDLTLACDYRCGHCIDSQLLNGGRHLPLEIVRGTLAVLIGRGLRSVILIGGGEPTLHPHFEEVVAAIKKLDLECAIASNGGHNERIASVAPLLGAKDWIRLSLDAGTDETFQALHLPRKPIRLEHICRTAGELKRRAPQVQLGFSFVVMWQAPGQRFSPAATNVHEMGQAAVLAKEYGFDYISFKPLLVRNADRAEVVNCTGASLQGTGAEETAALGKIRENLGAAQSVADTRFRVVPSRNLVALLDGHGLERSALQPSECHMQYFRQVVSPTGVFACPAHRGNPGSRLAGCDAYATVEAFQETSRATQLQIQRFNAFAACREITCIYNDANWWLEELIESGQPVQRLAASDFFL
jgi:pyruvate-formate lyase-activating enzyme